MYILCKLDLGSPKCKYAETFEDELEEIFPSLLSRDA